MIVQVKVYLNEGPGAFFGFNEEFNDEARLRMAAAFELPVAGTAERGPSENGLMKLLELIYEQLNIGGDMVPAMPFTETYRKERNRSLSVGDVVVLGETAWGCGSYGWEKVETERLTGAIARFNLEGAMHR